ncbi:MAG: TonB-dependent receptor [Proteobacteria bacterium]|nr:TonB-dependent receptor [Pseudomonadota bacterium]
MKKTKQSLLLACIFLSPSLFADKSVEKAVKLDKTIIVSDLRTDQLLIDSSNSISVLDSELLEKSGTQHFEDVLGLVPNLNWSSATNRPRYFQIRGIGERSQYEGAPNPSVGFVVDDIDFSALGGVATLFDVEQIEVLRGPQGTRYGANGLAGLIYVKTKAPEFDASYKVESLIGNDGDRALGFRATGGLSDNVAYRFSIHQYNANGFRYNDFLNRNDTNKRDEFVARGKLFWQANDKLDVNFTLLKAKIDNGFDTFNPENTFVTHTDLPGKDAQDSTGLAIRAQYEAENFDVLSISSYMNADIDYSFDGDWGNDESWGEFAPYDFTSASLRKRAHLSQEIRLLSNENSKYFNDSTDWLVGLYLLDMKEDNQINEFFNGFAFKNLSSKFDSTSVALFAQFDTELSNTNTLSTGVRLERRNASYQDSNGIAVSPTDNMWGGQISLNHKITDALNSYITLARGYKAGGFNLSLSVPDQLREYQPESLLNLESGFKGHFLDYQLQWNLSAFYSKRKDMQISTSRQTDPNDPLTFVFFTGNAATGSNYGIETDFSYQLSSSIDIYGSLGLLKAQFDDFVTTQGSFNGRDQAHAPNYNFALGIDYHLLNGFFARLDLNGKDSFYFSDSNNQQSKSYQLTNLRVGYEKNNWSVTLWGNNVFDKKYATRGFFFGLEPPNFENKLYTQLGSPRHIGVSFDVEF